MDVPIYSPPPYVARLAVCQRWCEHRVVARLSSRDEPWSVTCGHTVRCRALQAEVAALSKKIEMVKKSGKVDSALDELVPSPASFLQAIQYAKLVTNSEHIIGLKKYQLQENV